MKYAPVKLPDDATEQIAALLPREYVSNPATARTLADIVIAWLVQLPCVPIEDEPAVTEVARTLSACYVAFSGLLEDDPHRYTDAHRRHAEAVLAVLRGEDPGLPQPVGQPQPLRSEPAEPVMPAAGDPSLTETMIRTARHARVQAATEVTLETAGIPFAGSYRDFKQAQAVLVAVLRELASWHRRQGGLFGPAHIASLEELAALIEARTHLRPRKLRGLISRQREPQNGDVRDVDGRTQVRAAGAWFWLGEQVVTTE